MRTLILLAWLSLSVVSYTQTLVAYYPFNGNPNDESGNGRNPTYVGASLTTDRFGNANRAYAFSGAANGHIEYAANGLPAANRTISLWFYTSDVGNRPGLFGYGGNGSCGTTFFMALNLSGSGQYNAQGHCGYNPASYTYPSEPVNQWYHWVMTINGSSQKIYINGVLSSPYGPFTYNTSADPGTELSFGVIPHTNGLAPYTDANVGYFNGKLDDIRIYDAALSDAQVLQLYQNESTGLVAYYPFTGNANDESGNGHDGTVSNVMLTTDRKNETDKAYAFNGSTSSISAPAHADWSFNGGDFSIASWINVDIISTSRIVSAGYVDNDGIWGLGFGQHPVWGTGKRINFFVFSGNNYSDYSSNEIIGYSTGQWAHVGIIKKGTTLTFYFNGAAVGTAVITPPVNANSYLSIGCRQYTTGSLMEFFYGKIDELRIYKRALSPNEMAQLADIPFMPDLLAYLPMNGDANDKSGNNRHGSPYGNSQLTTDKYDNNNSAYSFTNPESGISLANTNTLDFVGQPFAISAWVRYSNIPAADFAIVAKHNCGVPNGYVLSVNNNTPRFYLSNGGWSIINAPQAYNDNKWHHLVATYDGIGSQKLYIDGDLKASATGIVYNNPSGTGTPIIIGDANGNCGGSTFSGSIDEVKIYDAALDAAQVMALYKQSRGSGNAISFDGTDDYLVTNEYLVPTSGDFTVELWVYNKNINGYREFISQGSGGSAFYIGTSDITGNIRLGDTWYTSVVLPLNKWVHLVVVKSGSNGVLYMDGVQVATSSTYGIGSGGTPTQIGKQYGGYLEHPEASLDEIRIWNSALSAADIRSWMNRKLTPEHPAFANLVGYYNFDEKNVMLAYETKGAKKGTLVNGPLYVTSGAPIGDASIANFSNPMTHGTILALSSGEQFSVTEPANYVDGVSVYVVKDPPEVQTGILGLGGNDHYFGVHISTNVSPTLYTAAYNYTGNTLVSTTTEPTLQLFKRANNSATAWANSGATLNTTANTLTVSGQNTEYILGSSGWGLPVTLLSLEAKKINATTTQLTWKTAQEINNKGFEVQRSFDGSYFVNIGFVNGAGNSDVMKEYRFADIPGKTGRIYYRLKQVDFDEQSKLSQIVSVIFDKQGIVKVYPNPAQQKVTIEGADLYNRIQLFDAGGRMVREKTNNNQYLFTLNLEGLKSGIYLLQLGNSSGSQTLKLVIGN